MSKKRGGKESFVCGGCGWVIRLLPSPKILLHGTVKPKVTHRCEACEEKGRIAKGSKQVFHHTPDVPEAVPEERVPALDKYI